MACSIQVTVCLAVRTEWYVLLLALQATDVVASLVVSLQANGKDVYVNR
jgi:cell division septation protein DedD